MECILDTDILSFFLRGDANVVAHVREYLADRETLCISAITHYEVLSGLMHRDAGKFLDVFEAFVRDNTVLPLCTRAVQTAAGIYADLRKAGNPIDDIDILIAGIAIARDMVLVTHNTNHFRRIEGLRLVDLTV